ncbi:MAG TPA: YIP1 family protein [Bacteroidales bacterium]|jgi:hypothetical protein|nr:YIP1 family protein [Bacteroidales bacterium]
MRDYLLTVIRPSLSFEKLLRKENYFSLGFVYILIPIAGYTLMYIFLTIGKGAPSVFTPWLNIPRDSYYSINRFLLAPSMLLCWITASAYIQIMSRSFRGSGTFEQSLAVLALSISIAMWGGLIHDLPMSFMSATGIIDARQHEIDMNSPTIFRTLLWICYSIYFIAFLILFPLAVKVVHRLSIIKSILIGWTAFIIFQVVFLIFNR